MDNCICAGCTYPARARGLCSAHYQRWRTGRAMEEPIRQTVRLPFWERVNKTGPCWLWTGPTDRDGYGLCGKADRAHRRSWREASGPIPQGMVVCHQCDNRLCVRPDHLFLGTQSDNVADMVSKQRQIRGERVGGSKMTESDVLAIRADSRTSVVIAAEYGLHHSTVLDIKNRHTWKHVS